MTSALALTLVGLAFCGAFVSSLVGAGGAFPLVPVLAEPMHIPLRLSIGSQVPLWAAAAVVLGSLGGAPLGGRVSRRVPLTVLRVVLAAIITVVMLRVWLDVATR